ncbi:MAG: GspH/FimT family pseudopilin [Methyloglobulus sp.]
MPLDQKDFQVMPQEPSRQHGFTLMELMVTLSVASVLAFIAIPSFTEIISNNRVTAQVNQFVSTLNFMRSEAVKQGVRISMCKTSDGMTCVADGAGSDWTQGWIVFTNQNNNKVYNGGDEIILKVQEAIKGELTITGNTNVDDIISYLPGGQVQNSGAITVCDDRRVGETGKRIVINSVGRSRIQTFACP